MNAKRTLTLGLALTAFLVGGSAASRSAGFSARVDNPWYPLEPGVIDHKYYVRGIGTVLEQAAKGPLERDELVSLRRGS